MAKGTSYRHFESKADLCAEVLARRADVFVARLRRALDPNASAADQIRRLGPLYFRQYTKPSQQEYFRIFWAIENQRLIGELPAGRVERVIGLLRQALTMLQEVIARGVKSGEFRDGDTWEVAHISGVAANEVLAAAVFPEQWQLFSGNVGEAFERLVGVLLRGISAR